MAVQPRVIGAAAAAVPINTIPQGLLGLLQVKELGRNPSSLLDAVAPHIDLFPFYVHRLIQGETGLFGGVPQTSALVTGNHGYTNFQVAGVNVTVPQNETWYVVAAGFNIATNTIAAADTISLQVGWTIPATGTVYSLCAIARDQITARARTLTNDPIPTPVWIPPGAGFLAMIDDILTGTSITVQLSLRAARLPI